MQLQCNYNAAKSWKEEGDYDTAVCELRLLVSAGTVSSRTSCTILMTINVFELPSTEIQPRPFGC